MHPSNPGERVSDKVLDPSEDFIRVDSIRDNPTNPKRDIRANILNTAKDCVLRDRTSTHGEPEDNFKAIAEMQTAYLRARFGFIGELTARDVAIMNIMQKIARTIQTPNHTDHWIDIAGYAACGGGEVCESQGS